MKQDLAIDELNGMNNSEISQFLLDIMYAVLHQSFQGTLPRDACGDYFCLKEDPLCFELNKEF